MLDTGHRVALISRPDLPGTVRWGRAGFITVRWDHGGESLVWGADLIRLPQTA